MFVLLILAEWWKKPGESFAVETEKSQLIIEKRYELFN